MTRGRPSPVDAPAERIRSRRFVLLLLLGLAGAIVAADLAAKHLAEQALRPDPDAGVIRVIRVIPGCLDFRWSENSGAVFGMGQGKRGLFIAFTLAATAGILWAALAYGRRSALLTIGLGLLLGGALGNLYDRIFISYVRDFIHAYAGRYAWPTFNVADMAICAGAAVVILHSFRQPNETHQENKH